MKLTTSLGLLVVTMSASATSYKITRVEPISIGVGLEQSYVANVIDSDRKYSLQWRGEETYNLTRSFEVSSPEELGTNGQLRNSDDWSYEAEIADRMYGEDTNKRKFLFKVFPGSASPIVCERKEMIYPK